MKRLFRTSKSPVVDPLPPPTSTPASGASTPTHHHHEHRWPFGHSHQPEVTPFPIDAGRETAQAVPPPPPMSNEARKGKQRGPSGGSNPNSNAPSMLEIQQMQERDQSMRSNQAPPRRQHHDQQHPHHQHHQTRPSKGYGGSATTSPDGWTMVSPSNNSIPIPSPGSNGHGNTQMYDHSLNEPLSIPNASFATSPTPSSNNSPSSASTHTALYLPPGARPATPPSMRPPYPPPTGSARHSQASLSSMSTAHYGEAGDIISPPPNSVGRERGQSIVSATGSLSNRSDHDTSSKLQKPLPSQPIRSPLANSYPSPEVTSFPSPHPYASPPTQSFQAQPMPNVNPNAYNPTIPRAEEMPNAVNLSRRGSQMDGKEKKRGFLGMGWGKGKDKEKKDNGGELNRPILEETRRSFDAWRNPGQSASGETESQPSSTHGHSTSHGHEPEEPSRSRLLGLDFGGGDKRNQQQQQQQQQPNDAGSAIRWLCAQPDPPPSQIYDVCDRIHKSEGMEGITKDAARAIRKEFKGGNENERKNAAKVWLYLMRNVSVKGFRQHASSKKFLSSLEPILLAPATKPLVSQPTYRLMTDILSDLTFSYGQEKGCEGLGELWKKVKLPQESDIGNPLPVDHPIFSPEPFYTQRSSHQHVPSNQPFPSSRRASSPSLQHTSALQQDMLHNGHRVASPAYGGPGYANLPSHGDDIRKLVDECTAAKESARVLSEALIFTRPDELERKPIIGEFYRKVFLAHESLTNQMDWAQAEAARSRERSAALTLDGNPNTDNTKHDTSEEQALATLLEAHSALGEALKQHDDLSKLAGEEREMREVRERSKKDTKMDRNHQTYEHSGLLSPANQPQASSSRSPSPVPHMRIPPDSAPKVTSSPRNYDQPLPPPSSGGVAVPIPASNNPFRNTSEFANGRISRTPSPDHHHPLPHPPKLSSSPGPGRTSSPLGRLRMAGPRPLPNPFAKGNNASHQSLNNLANSAHAGSEGGTVPSRNGSGDTPSRSGTGDSSSQGGAHLPADEIDGDDLPPKPIKPSRKALGKRRAVIDEDNHFNPDDMFNPSHTNPRAINRDAGQGNYNNNNNNDNDNNSSEEDYTTLSPSDERTKNKQKIVYAYDAYEERQLELKKAAESLKISEKFGGGGGGGSGRA
uniref:VHS domain-containing protein n=1 Tax=Kwoniella dejecticola CBS 10117 TaxID=1296121 RepID=A0A1A6ADE0_9TREE|nr:uncharacterized protein I303_02301 [Kwoniella dejecticola CBS 10117]OBR88082.1 hypothetical protein I303_02301 [Kwoniella dejecticola CBS 10117]